MKKQKRVMTCLIAGVLILAVSATAAFGSINGYARYKQAVKALALEEENFTAAGIMTMTVDGEAIWTMEAEAALDREESSSRITMTQGGIVQEQQSATVDGTRVWYAQGDEGIYHSMPAGSNEGPYNLLGFEPDDEYSRRLITFFEVACDTVVGELKNNFVQIGTEEGVDLYQVDIAQAQVPSLVNAGLSLFAYTVTQDANDAWYATFEDAEATMFHYYETRTGETLPQEFKESYSRGWTEEWYQANQELVERFDSVCYSDGYWGDAYDKILEDNDGGIVYVYADGSYDYYTDRRAFLEDHPEETADNLEAYIGEDLILEHIHCTFGVDADGHLTETRVAVTFTTTDLDGRSHELVIAGEAVLGDYGTTTVTMPDLTGRTEVKLGEPTVEAEAW